MVLPAFASVRRIRGFHSILKCSGRKHVHTLLVSLPGIQSDEKLHTFCSTPIETETITAGAVVSVTVHINDGTV